MSGEPRAFSHKALLYKKAAVFPRGVIWVQNSFSLSLSLSLSLSRLKNWQRAKQLNVINVGLLFSYLRLKLSLVAFLPRA